MIQHCLYQRIKLPSAIEPILRKPILVFSNINPRTTIRAFDNSVAYCSATESEVVGIQKVSQKHITTDQSVRFFSFP